MKTYQVLSVAALAAVALSATVRAGGDKVVFPENYAKGVLYTTVDRADNKHSIASFTRRRKPSRP